MGDNVTVPQVGRREDDEAMVAKALKEHMMGQGEEKETERAVIVEMKKEEDIEETLDSTIERFGELGDAAKALMDNHALINNPVGANGEESRTLERLARSYSRILKRSKELRKGAGSAVRSK